MSDIQEQGQERAGGEGEEVSGSRTYLFAEDGPAQAEDRPAGLKACRIHPEDLAKHRDFLAAAGKKPGWTGHLDYRLLTEGGQVRHVRESLRVCKRDGQITGEAFITDVSDLAETNGDLRFLNETIPCGFLRYGCEKQPRVTYVNRRMLEILHVNPDDSGSGTEAASYMNDILLAIPIGDRRRFASYLKLVHRRGMPVAGEMTLLACDGSRVRVYGWVTKALLPDGREEFQSVCMDITDRYRHKREQEDRRYLRAISEVYEEILSFNQEEGTVTCLQAGPESAFRNFENIAMQTSDARDRWLRQTVAEEDQERVRCFLCEEAAETGQLPTQLPPQIRFRSGRDEQAVYTAVFLKFNETSRFLCVRRSPEEEKGLAGENDRLRKNMKGLIQNFTDGVAAFEVMPDHRVRPLYASENVAEFFGVTEDRWLTLVREGISLEELASCSEASLEDFEALLQDGEAEFDYFDFNRGEDRRIKAVCSERDCGGEGPRYVMLYHVSEQAEEKRGRWDRRIGGDRDAKRQGESPEQAEVFIRSFGYFDVFVDGKPIAFRNKKSKELLALLVDRRGGFISSDEAVSFLWEDEFVSSVTLSRYRKVALRLKNLLEEYGIADIVETVDGKRRIVPDRVSCDLFDYLTGEKEYRNLFTGSYLSNYSWGETTLAGLLARKGEDGDIFV